MNSATTGANSWRQALAKCSFHFVSWCCEDKTLPDLSKVMLTLKAHHTLIWRRADNQTSAAAPLESVIPAECWQEPQISLWNGINAAFIVCVDIKILSFQSAARMFIILQEWNKCFGKYCYKALNILSAYQSQSYGSWEQINGLFLQ